MRALALCGVVAPVVFTAAWVAGTLVQDGYSPVREDLSALAARTADHAWIAVAGLVVTGVLTALFAPALHAAVGGGRGSRLGPALVALGGIGIVGLGLLRNDCSSLTPACEARVDAGDVSWEHTAHAVLSAPVFAFAVLAPFVLVRRFRADPVWAPFAPWSLAASVVLAALFILGGVEAVPGWDGLLQRLAVSLALLWLGASALRARAALCPSDDFVRR
jgi:hypothetical protein